MDFACWFVIYFLIGYAIHKMKVPLVSESLVENVATLLDMKLLCKEDGDRVSM